MVFEDRPRVYVFQPVANERLAGDLLEILACLERDWGLHTVRRMEYPSRRTLW